jgi:hypothetical protein
MASWDTPAVAAPSTASYAAPLVNFDELGKLPETYLKMKEMKRQDDVANACRNGIPRVDPNNPNSTPDYIAMSETMLKLGNYPEATTLQNTGIQMQQLRNAQRIADQYFSPSASAGSGQPSTAASATGSPARTQPTTSPSTSSAAQPKTVMTIMAAQGTPNDQLQAVSDSVARQLGVGPNDPIDTSDPRVRNVLAGAIKQFRKASLCRPNLTPPQTRKPRLRSGYRKDFRTPSRAMASPMVRKPRPSLPRLRPLLNRNWTPCLLPNARQLCRIGLPTRHFRNRSANLPKSALRRLSAAKTGRQRA